MVTGFSAGFRVSTASAFRGFGFLKFRSHRATCMRQAQYDWPPEQFDEPGGLGFIYSQGMNVLM